LICFANKTFGDIHNVKPLEVLLLFDLSSDAYVGSTLPGADQRAGAVFSMSLSGYAPCHPLASRSRTTKGYVNIARHIVSIRRGTWIQSDKVVRFADGNVGNFSGYNLLVVTHASLTRVMATSFIRQIFWIFTSLE
jgi:hypothetical protein